MLTAAQYRNEVPSALETTEDSPPSVFTSYTRSDSSALAEEVKGGLELAGFTAFVDRDDISGPRAPGKSSPPPTTSWIALKPPSPAA